MTIHTFTEIKAWKEAKRLALHIYTLTNTSSFKRDFNLCRQIQSAAVSVMSNIAEGFGRGSDKEFRYFLKIAKASNIEVQSHGYLACDLKYMTNEDLKKLLEISTSTHRAISAFIHYLTKRI